MSKFASASDSQQGQSPLPPEPASDRPDAGPSNLPSGTVTFFFTDIEGSTRLWEQQPEAMKAALARHDAILQQVIKAQRGHIVKSTGDGIHAVFASAASAVAAALAAQLRLHADKWEEVRPQVVRVRIGLHTSEAELRAGDYYGPAVNRAARLMAVAYGGQTLLSATTGNLTRDQLPAGASLRDLGEHGLKDLERSERVYQLVHPALPADFPPLKSLNAFPNNLPTQLSTFVGRQAQVQAVKDLLIQDPPGVRLLTLTGPGGTGKTRLALQAAAALSDRFDGGEFFVDLAPLREPEPVLAAIAQAVGLRQTGDRALLDELKAQLRPRRILLLLDNFEQVTAAAPNVADLLRDCPQLKALVTSREALRVRGEHVLPLPPLELPPDDFRQMPLEALAQVEAVRLFLERARAVKPDFSLTTQTAAAVAEICLRLDGLPLAIELASARINLFSPQALLERVGSRLKLLRGGARDLALRQQTLRATIDWSYDLLEGGEQRLFALLAVFAGCTYDAAETVAGGIQHLNEAEGDVLDGLASLVNKSLLRQVDQEAGEPRLLMLETIREYAAERLNEDPAFSAAVGRAHATYFANFAQRQGERMTGEAREAALAELEADIENVRSAWRYWAAQGDLEQLGKFTDSLWSLNDARGWYHATVHLTADLLRVLAATPPTAEHTRQEIVLRTSLARALLADKGYTPEVEEAYNRALELSETAGEAAELFPVLRGLFSIYLFRAQFDKVLLVGTKILNLAERYDDAYMRVEAHLALGTAHVFSGDIQLGLQHLDHGIAYIDPDRQRSSRFRLGNYPGVACYTTSALVLWGLGFPDRALQRALAAVELASRINHSYSLAYALFHTGLLQFWRREIDDSLACAQALLKVADKHGFQIWIAVGICLQGAGLASVGQPEEGLALIQRGMDMYQGLKSPPVFWGLLRGLQAGACGQAGRPEEGLALLEGVTRLPDTGYGGVLIGDSYHLKGNLLLARSPDQPAEAESMLQLALQIAREKQAPMVELRAALRLAWLWSKTDKAQQGRQLLSDAYAKLTEGFTLPDLMEAKALLTDLP